MSKTKISRGGKVVLVVVFSLVVAMVSSETRGLFDDVAGRPLMSDDAIRIGKFMSIDILYSLVALFAICYACSFSSFLNRLWERIFGK